ncbi:MAG TPA: DUF2279 domain-containing protein [Bacteroidota bacterium]|nr:DUF2279 domain-containing protein [Bacteroidota bacterium]
MNLRTARTILLGLMLLFLCGRLTAATPNGSMESDTAHSPIVAISVSHIDTVVSGTSLGYDLLSEPASGTTVEQPSRLSAAPLPRHDNTLWIFNRKTLALGGTLGFSIPIVVLEYQWWWREDYQYKPHKFRFENDGWFENGNRGVDKTGHFFTSYLYFHTFYDLMKWADYSESASLWTALAVPAAHAISVELCDGFSKYSFSAYDLIANFLGMGYAYAQIKHPYLNNFNIKWSYYPTSGGNAPSSTHGFAEDYSGHTYWVSVNMQGVLPEAVAQYWPKYLNLAVGYGASNVSHNENNTLAKNKFAFALDYNLSAIDIANDTWSMLLRFADKFHYPAPGIKVYTGGETKAKPLLLY